MKPRTRTALIAWIIAFAMLMFTAAAHAELEDPQLYKGFPQLSPEINNYTGSAAQSIPVAVPPGRLGLQPSLAFTYNSYLKSGILGFGWEIELGHIQRRTKWGVHYDQDEFDIVFSGQKSELVPISDKPDYFRARIESDFNQYHFMRSGDYWEVIRTDGTRSYFGYDPHLNQGRNARQSNDLGTFKWCLAHVRDTNGNYMTVDYLLDQNQVYPQYINYTGGVDSEPANLVEFTYESADRPDPQISYASKSRVVTALRLESVKTYAYTNGPADTPALEYRLEYEQSAESQVSLLKRIRIIGSDGVRELPGYSFDYQSGSLGRYPTGVDYVEVESIPLGDNNEYDRFFTDINGDNKDDLILVKKFSNNGNGGIIKVYPSNGDGTFGYPISSSLGEVQDDANYRTTIVDDILYQSDHFADINGDARPDLVQYNYKIIHGDERSWVKVNQIRTFTANFNGTFSPGQVLDLGGDNYYGDVSLNVVDLNRDGYADIYFRGRGATFQNDGHGNFTQVATPSFPGSGVYTRYLVDINGDGLTDLVNYNYSKSDPTLLAREFSTYLADGRGGFVQANTQEFMELFPDEVLPNRKEGKLLSISFSDVNNDGRPDLVIKTKRDSNDPPLFQIWLSDGAGTFTFYRMRSGWGNTTADLNGDGVDDLVEIKHEETQLDNGTIVVYTNYIKSRISQNVVPYNLMINATSPSGAAIAYTYGFSSSQNQLFLPFLMYPVATVTVDDGVRSQPSVSTYTQELGYYDGAEKEYRGFELSSRTNPDNTFIQTYHFVGLENHPDHPDYPGMPDDCSLDNYYLNGRIRQVDLFDAPEGNLLTRTRYQWRMVEHPTDGWAFVKPAQKRTEYYDDQTVSSQEDYVYDVDEDGLTADSAGLLKKTTASGTGAADVVTEYDYVNYSGDAYAPLWRKTLDMVYEEGQGTAPSRHFEYVYDTGTGNLVQKIGRSGDPGIEDSIRTYDYYANGLLHHDYDANGHPPTNYALYDETRTFPTSVIDPLGHETTKTWDARWGLETTVTDPNLQTTAFTYDEFGRLKRTDSPDGGYTQLVFSDYCTDQACSNVGLPRQVQAKVRTVGSQTEDTLFYFDGLARKVQTSKTGESGNFIIAKTHYDTMGRAEFTSGPFFRNSDAYLAWNDYTQAGYDVNPGEDYPFVFTEFDKRGRPLSQTSPDGQNGPAVTGYAYSGFATTVTDPDGDVKTEVRDHLDRIIEVIEDPSGEDIHTHYAYNASGDLLEVYNAFDPDASRVQIAYDAMGRKTSMDDPDLGNWSYEYYPNGELKLQTDAKGQSVQFTYDDGNRLLTKTYLDPQAPTPAVTYAYDAAVNGIGRLYSVTNNDVTTTVSAYDEIGRKTEEQKSITGATPRTSSWTYDYAGRVQRLTYPHTEASTIFYVDYAYYPGTSLLYTATGPDGTVFARMTGYQPTGKIGDLVFGNDVKTAYGYDGWSQRLTSIVTAMNQGAGTQHQNRTYTYSKAGDIKVIDDQAWVETYYYEYDKLHRLISETTSAGSQGVIPGNFAMAYNDPDHLHAVSHVTSKGVSYAYAYDENGNMTQGPDLTDVQNVVGRKLSFNADNMPLTVEHPSGGSISITYDGEAKRAQKTGSSGTTYYFSNEFELDGTTETCYVFAGNLRVAMVKDYAYDQVKYFHKDHLGSSSVITKADGTIYEKTRYMPFGGKRGDGPGITSTAYQFTDQELDAESGLYNYDARLYDPVIGRFASADTIIPAMEFSSQLLNRYSYVSNNPLIFIDPTGHHLGGYNGPDHNGPDDIMGLDTVDYDKCGYDLSENPGNWGKAPTEEQQTARDSIDYWESIQTREFLSFGMTRTTITTTLRDKRGNVSSITSKNNPFSFDTATSLQLEILDRHNKKYGHSKAYNQLVDGMNIATYGVVTISVDVLDIVLSDVKNALIFGFSSGLYNFDPKAVGAIDSAISGYSVFTGLTTAGSLGNRAENISKSIQGYANKVNNERWGHN